MLSIGQNGTKTDTLALKHNMESKCWGEILAISRTNGKQFRQIVSFTFTHIHTRTRTQTNKKIEREREKTHLRLCILSLCVWVPALYA